MQQWETWLAERIRDSAAEAAIVAVGGFLGTGLVAAWMYAKERQTVWLRFAVGMFCAYASVVALTAALLFANWQLLFCALSVVVVGTLVFRVLRSRRAEAEALRQHPKGFLDHFVEWKKNRLAWESSFKRISEEMGEMGRVLIVRADSPDCDLEDFDVAHRFTTENAREIKLSARRIKAAMFDFETHSVSLLSGVEGRIKHSLATFEDYRLGEKSKADNLLLLDFKDSLMEHRWSLLEFIQKLNGVVGLNQRMNAAVSELKGTMDSVMKVLDEIIGRVDRIRGALAGSAD